MQQSYAYLIEYPEFFSRECSRDGIELPEICKHPNDLINWLIDNNERVIEPLISELRHVVCNREDELRQRFNVQLDRKTLGVECVSDMFSFDSLPLEDDAITMKVSLLKPFIVKKNLTEHVDEVKIAGLPYQPASTRIIGSVDVDLGIDVVCEFYFIRRVLLG